MIKLSTPDLETPNEHRRRGSRIGGPPKTIRYYDGIWTLI